MEDPATRQRLTLSDQLFGRGGTVTLAAVLEADKNSDAASTAGGGGRTLLDVIREEEDSESSGDGSLRWRNLIRIRPAATPARPEARSETIRVSLMTLMEIRESEEEGEEERRRERAEEIDGDADVAEEEKEEGRFAHVCCVCMVKKKGAAFIPCGHTFCRVCSRELFMGRGNCPLCNASIVEVLDIF